MDNLQKLKECVVEVSGEEYVNATVFLTEAEAEGVRKVFELLQAEHLKISYSPSFYLKVDGECLVR